MYQIGILGCGAMGCLYGTALTEDADNAVTFIDRRPERVDFFNRNGVTVRENGVARHFRVRSILGRTAPPEAFDFVLVTVKAHQTETAVRENAALFAPNTVIISLQNGLGNLEIISKLCPDSPLVAGISNHNSTLLAPGEILHPSAGAQTLAGGLTASGRAAAQKTAAVFRKSGLGLTVVEDIRREIWRKLLINCAINPITALSNQCNGFLVSDPAARREASEIMREGIAAAAAEGVIFSGEKMLEHLEKVCRATAGGKSSMLQDILTGRRTEIDFINGAVAAVARRHGLPADANRSAADRIHRLEQTRNCR